VTRRILLADADAFFVAVARLVDPEGAGRAPLLIVGGAPGSRGVVCSASYETRRFGVRSAMPISRALRLCPQAMCVPVPRGACSRLSREIRRVLERFAPIVEGASIDEWYLDLTGTERLYRDEPLEATAHRIRDAVREATTLSVSFGGGTSRLVAKMAVEVAKPKPGSSATGVHVVPEGEEEQFLRRFELGDLPQVGPRFRERLESFGLRTVPELLATDPATLERWIGAGAAQWLRDRARGIDDSPVEGREVQKQVSREDTFPADIADDAALEAELLRLAVRVTADLRQQRLAARTVTVKLRDADFRTRSASRTLPEPVIADRPIFEVARELLRKLRRARRTPARLLGVALASLAPPDDVDQLALFDDARGAEAVQETARDRALAAAVDRLRERFGSGAIGPARLAERRER
jgi:DNA polymerase-4